MTNLPGLVIESATPEEREPALRLLLRHCDADSLPSRLAASLRMIATGELDAEGLLVLREGSQLVGAAAATVVPGRSGIVWPPRAIAGPNEGAYEDLLAVVQRDFVQARGAVLAQAILTPDEAYLAGPLLRNGYRHVTSLWYLRHDREMSITRFEHPIRLRWQTYAEADRAVFHECLARTFADTLDCPEVTEARNVEEVVLGFQAQSAFDPECWWLAWHKGEPAGILITSALPGRHTWEICYLGVVPERRRQGLGRELVLKALFEARTADVLEVFLTVDVRNEPAWALYTSLGFDPFDRREVFLHLS